MFIVIIFIFDVNDGNSQSYTLDWTEFVVEQFKCEISSDGGITASYSDLDLELLKFSDTKININHRPTNNIYCASGKARNRNGGTTHVYNTILDGSFKDDCSWMIIEFSQPVQNVSFDLIDIDLALQNNWQDE